MTVDSSVNGLEKLWDLCDNFPLLEPQVILGIFYGDKTKTIFPKHQQSISTKFKNIFSLSKSICFPKIVSFSVIIFSHLSHHSFIYENSKLYL